MCKYSLDLQCSFLESYGKYAKHQKHYFIQSQK